jgi:hypothetical protein
MVTPRQAAPAVAQPEQRVELLDQFQGQPPAAHRPNRHRVAGGRVSGHLQDRIGDVEPAADVDQPVVVAGQASVARRRELLDEPVLEYERPQLGARRAVVDHRCMGRPGRRR